MIRGFSIISPASSYLIDYPNRVERGCKFLNKCGYNVNFEKNASKKMLYYSGTADERVEDINNALENENTDIIMASIGGYNSNQLLDKLDYEKISESNKIFCGYSDITCLLLAIYVKTKKIVFHGPTFLPEICEYPQPYEYTWNCLNELLNNSCIDYKVPNYEIKEFIDWKQEEINLVVKQKDYNNCAWKVNKRGKTKAEIIGGNLSSILTILGTEYLPIEVFDNKILFLEDVNISIGEFDSLMQALRLRGIFKNINGLIIGKFVEDDNNIIINYFLNEFFKEEKFPILYNVDLGHTNPKITIPIGAIAEIECGENIRFRVEF